MFFAPGLELLNIIIRVSTSSGSFRIEAVKPKRTLFFVRMLL